MKAELADGRILEFPDGTDPAVVQATVKKVLSATPPAAKSVPAMYTPSGERPLIDDIPAAIAGHPLTRVALGAASPVIGALQLKANTDPIFRMTGMNTVINDQVAKLDAMKQRGMAMTGDQGFDAYGLGGAVVNPAGLGIAKAIPQAGTMLQRILQGSNIGTGMALATPDTSNPQTLADTLKNAAANAGIGGFAGALGAPIAALASKTASGVGSLWDILSGRQSGVTGGKILREAAGDGLPVIRQALENAPSGVTATQATQPAITKDTWNALGELARSKDKTNYFTNLSAGQKEEVLQGLRLLAGGANQTEAKQSAEVAKQLLNQVTKPTLDAVADAANTAGTVGRRLQTEATELGDAASNRVADVRRLARAGQVADDVGNSGRMRLDGGSPPVPGLPRVSGRYSYGAELSELADRLATKAADDSLLLGQASRFKQMQVDSLAEHGLRPLDAKSIISAIDAKLKDPKIGSGEINERVLSKVKERISEWTNADGVIDFHALHGIRKGAVNDAIEQLMGASDPKSKALRAAGILRQVKPLIDDAVEKSGGTQWRNYLSAFENGMRQIEQQKMGAKAVDLFERQPAKLESLVAGNEPKLVEKVFGTQYNLNEAMGDKIGPLQRAAGVLSRDRVIAESAARGEGGLTGILSDNVSKFKLPNWLNAKIALTNRALDVLETQVNRNTMNKVYEAMKTGQSALDLINTIPTAERNKVLMAISMGKNDAMSANVATQIGTRNREDRASE